MDIILLCVEFFKIGLFAVGGGMAAIPFLIQMSESYPQWFSLAMLTDMIAVSESTPGPIGINMATYVGYTVAGIPGGILATLSLVLPSFVIMLIVVRSLQKYRDSRFVNAVFSGLRPAVTGLIAAAGYAVLKLSFFTGDGVNIPAIILFTAIFTCTQLKNIHPVVYIAISAVAGVVFSI